MKKKPDHFHPKDRVIICILLPLMGPGSIRWNAVVYRINPKAIATGNFLSIRQLWTAFETFVGDHNHVPKPFKRVKSADQILASIAQFAQSAIS